MRTKNLVFSVFTLLLFTSFAYAQVTGVVVDDFGPLPDAVVTVDETGVSTTTGEDGAFSIEAQVGDNLTILNPTSLSEMNVAVTGMNLGNLNMSASAIGLDDVISVGYTTFKETDITSSVSNVSSEEVEQIPIPSLDQMLQGRAAGVNVSIGSGQPGASGTITIRGSNSLQGDDEPLFIIDGVPVDTDNFRSLNMNDVADITIIKDAAGAALYGSRAAGGVVVVTTKKGNFDQKLKLQYRTQFGVSIKPTPNFDVMNSTQYLNYQNQYGIGTGAGLTPEEISQLASTNTDWTDVFLKNGYLNSHEINASVGSENFRSYTSLGYLDQDGITYRSNLQRFTFRNNAEYKKDKITVGANITSNYSKSDFVIDANRDSNTGGELDNPFIVPYIGIPYYNPYNEDGSLNTIGTIQSGALNADGTLNVSGANGFPNTPYLALNTLVMNEDQEEELRTVGNIYADYKFTDWLSAGVNFGLDYQDTERYYLDHPNSIRGQLSPSTEANLKGYRYQLRSRILDIVNTTNLTFNKTFNEKHNLTLSAFLEYNKEYRRSFGYNANGINPAFATSIGGLVSGETVEEVDGEETRPYIASIVGGSQDRGLLSYFGIMNYSFDSRYILGASIRRDASSFFPESNKWGTFWSVSGRWNISNEAFFGKDLFNNLSIRASYGTVGNQELFTPFGQYDLFAPGSGYNATAAIYPSAIGNPELKWEETAMLNLGMDFGLWNEKFTGSVDYYHNNSTDLLIYKPLSTLSGFSSRPDNVGEMINQGVDLELNYNVYKNQNFDVDLWFNGNYNKNEITELYDDLDIVGSFYKGYAKGSFRQVRWAGVNPADGTPLYLDADGNLTGIYSLDDRVISDDKSLYPKFTGGFGSSISYKKFTFNMAWSFAAEQYRVNSSLAIVEDPSLASFSNQSTTMLDAWQEPGDVSSIPNPLLGGLRSVSGDRYLEDASFLRLRNVVLGYTLSKDQFVGLPVQSIRIFAQAQNIVTFTKWRGFDPELNSNSSFFDYPAPRIFTFGFDINF